MRKLTTILLVAALALSAASCSGEPSNFMKAIDMGVPGHDYNTLCKTYSGKFTKGVSPKFQRLPSATRNEAHRLVADDPLCQPKEN